MMSARRSGSGTGTRWLEPGIEASRPFAQIAAPVHRLDVVGMVVAPGSAHSFGLNVVGNGIGAAPELPPAESAPAVLFDDLSFEQVAHFCRRALLAIAARMMGILDTAQTEADPLFAGRPLPPAAAAGSVNGTKFVAREFHNESLH
jgi:hypothetical protein